jgi:hypothetical protein
LPDWIQPGVDHCGAHLPRTGARHWQSGVCPKGRVSAVLFNRYAFHTILYNANLQKNVLTGVTYQINRIIVAIQTVTKSISENINRANHDGIEVDTRKTNNAIKRLVRLIFAFYTFVKFSNPTTLQRTQQMLSFAIALPVGILFICLVADVMPWRFYWLMISVVADTIGTFAVVLNSLAVHYKLCGGRTSRTGHTSASQSRSNNPHKSAKATLVAAQDSRIAPVEPPHVEAQMDSRN